MNEIKSKKIFHYTGIKLSHTEKYILDKINNDPENFLQKNSSEFCKSISVSSAALSKLRKKMGFKTFREMLFYVHKNKNDENDTSNTNMNPLESHFHKYVSAITYLSNWIDYSEFKKATRLMLKATKILLFGLGSSYNSADDLSDFFDSVGINSVALNDIHKLLHLIEAGYEKHLIIILSSSLETKEVKFIIKTLIKRKDDFIIISSTKSETIKRSSAAYLWYATPNIDKNTNYISNIIAQKLILSGIEDFLIKEKIVKNNSLITEWNNF